MIRLRKFLYMHMELERQYLILIFSHHIFILWNGIRPVALLYVSVHYQVTDVLFFCILHTTSLRRGSPNVGVICKAEHTPVHMHTYLYFYTDMKFRKRVRYEINIHFVRQNATLPLPFFVVRGIESKTGCHMYTYFPLSMYPACYIA